MVQYITTRELNDKYGVSNVTVAKWLLQTSKGETGLTYDKVGKRIRIINNKQNWAILNELGSKASNKRQKIFSSEAHVNKEFYTYFSDDEITEIVRDLEFKRYINFKFTYKGEGAHYWDHFYQENEENGTYKTPGRTKEILEYYTPFIIDKMKNYDEVNIVEIGPGNALPVINFIKKIKDKIPLKKYIGIDISSDLLDQSVENLSAHIDNLEYITLTKDIERDRIDSAFSHSYSEDKKVGNIVLILGGTILNSFESSSILQNIRRSLSPHDILLFNSNISDSVNNTTLAYNYSPDAIVQDTWIPRMLGIDVDKCEVRGEYEEKYHRKAAYIILDKDYTLIFSNNNFNRKVTLQKKEKIYVWTYSVTDLDSGRKMFEDAGYRLIDAITLADQKHFMIAVQTQ